MNKTSFAERLKAHGWTREPKAEKEFAKDLEVEAYKKRVNGVWIRIVIPQALFTTTAHVSSTTTPKTADVNDYSSKAMKLINLTATMREVDALAEEVASIYSSYERKKTDYSFVIYRTWHGEAAMQAWKRDVERAVLDILETTRSTRPREIRASPSSTKSLVSNIVDNYGITLTTTKSKQNAMIRSVLEGMRRNGQIVRLTGYNDEPEWSID